MIEHGYSLEDVSAIRALNMQCPLDQVDLFPKLKIRYEEHCRLH